MDIEKPRGRRGALGRAAVVLPVVLVSASWTISVADVGAAPIAAGQAEPRPRPAALPEVAVPEASPEPPASVARPGRASSPAVRGIASTPGATDIPAVALAAYQRAAAVIGAADADCGLGWPVVAAIGRVESDHGRTGRSVLDAAGVATPGIVGPALDGDDGTALVSDTDAGRLDADPRFDRAVGPLQFLPSTWGVVGVDADDDGQRNPQDVDDAALATAVYLCSGDGDLGVAAELRRALLRYNPSNRYVRLVVEIAKGYASGAPVQSASAGFQVPPAGPLAEPARAASSRSGAREDGARSSADDAQRPPDPPSARPPGGARPGTPPPAAVPPRDGLVSLLSQTEAVLRCTLQGLSQLLQPTAYADCVDELTGSRGPAASASPGTSARPR